MEEKDYEYAYRKFLEAKEYASGMAIKFEVRSAALQGGLQMAWITTRWQALCSRVGISSSRARSVGVLLWFSASSGSAFTQASTAPVRDTQQHFCSQL